MKPTDIRSRTQIEAWLGRPLADDECTPVASLAALTAPHLAVVRQLAARQLVICIAYLLAITPSSARDVLLFTREL